jgi:hypothetical protein
MHPLTSELEKLNGSVVVFESLRYDGRFIDAHDSKIAKITGCYRSDLPEVEWTKFIIHHIQDNIVCLESLRYRDHYLDMNDEKSAFDDRNLVKITSSYDIPTEQSWARFSVWGDNCGKVGIRSERWTDRWLDAHESGNLLGTLNSPDSLPPEPWGHFKLGFSALVKERWENIQTVDNRDNSNKSVVEYSRTEGVSKTNTESSQFSVGIFTELERNLKVPMFQSGPLTLGAQFSGQWSSTTSETFSSSTTRKYKIEVAPGKIVEIRQLIADYGDNISVRHEEEIDINEVS